MIRKIFFYTLWIGILTACSSGKTEKKTVAVDTIPMLVQHVQKCSKLYTTKIEVHKIITHSDTKQISGTFLKQKFSVNLPFGERKVAIPIEATVKTYIDFQDFSEQNIKKDGNKLEIILPDPRIEITSTRINHQEIRSSVPMLRSDFSDKELSNFELQGRDAIVKDLSKLNLIALSQIHASKILIPLFSSMGFQKENITITFNKGLNVNKLSSFVESPAKVN